MACVNDDDMYAAMLQIYVSEYFCIKVFLKIYISRGGIVRSFSEHNKQLGIAGYKRCGNSRVSGGSSRSANCRDSQVTGTASVYKRNSSAD